MASKWSEKKRMQRELNSKWNRNRNNKKMRIHLSWTRSIRTMLGFKSFSICSLPFFSILFNLYKSPSSHAFAFVRLHHIQTHAIASHTQTHVTNIMEKEKHFTDIDFMTKQKNRKYSKFHANTGRKCTQKQIASVCKTGVNESDNEQIKCS